MDHYILTRRGERVYTVTERYVPEEEGSSMGLVVGDDRALLMDTGMGVTGNIRKFVEQFTQKPVICALTHPHPDHAGAAALFETVYLNEEDNSMLSWAVTKEKRLAPMRHLFGILPTLEEEIAAEMVDSSKLKTIPMPDNTIFELGGITVTAISLKGHTAGSSVFYCRKENVLFTGDSVEPVTMYIGEGPEDYLPIRVYLAELKKLRGIINDDTVVYCYHKREPVTPQLIDDMIICCEKAISSEASRAEVKLPPFLMEKEKGREYYRETVGTATLVYDMASVE